MTFFIYGRDKSLVHYLYTDVAVPHIVAMVLNTYVTLMLVTAAVVEELEAYRPFFSREF